MFRSYSKFQQFWLWFSPSMNPLAFLTTASKSTVKCKWISAPGFESFKHLDDICQLFLGYHYSGFIISFDALTFDTISWLSSKKRSSIWPPRSLRLFTIRSSRVQVSISDADNWQCQQCRIFIVCLIHAWVLREMHSYLHSPLSMLLLEPFRSNPKWKCVRPNERCLGLSNNRWKIPFEGNLLEPTNSIFCKFHCYSCSLVAMRSSCIAPAIII